MQKPQIKYTTDKIKEHAMNLFRTTSRLITGKRKTVYNCKNQMRSNTCCKLLKSIQIVFQMKISSKVVEWLHSILTSFHRQLAFLCLTHNKTHHLNLFSRWKGGKHKCSISAFACCLSSVHSLLGSQIHKLLHSFPLADGMCFLFVLIVDGSDEDLVMKF